MYFIVKTLKFNYLIFIKQHKDKNYNLEEQGKMKVWSMVSAAVLEVRNDTKNLNSSSHNCENQHDANLLPPLHCHRILKDNLLIILPE